MSQVLDLDKVIPEPRTITLEGKIFDITRIPFETALKVYDLIPILSKTESGTVDKEDYKSILDLLTEILHNCDNTITYDWVRNVIDIKRFREIMPFVTSAIFEDLTKKNEKEAEEDSLKSI